MKRVMVTYRVKTDRADDNERYVRAVFAELERERPAGIRYASFKADDGVTFVHIASVETADGRNPLAALASFKAFSSKIEDRCESPPVAATLHEVGNHGVLA